MAVERPGERREGSVTVEGRESAVAVIGMGCELPSARGPRELWRLLAEARDAVGPARAGTGLRRAGHIDGAGCSDLTRFGIDPDEAARMDPQQHVLLRVVHDAIADAGLDPAGIAGSPTAVCVGQSASDFWDLRSRSAGLDLGDFVGSHQRGLLSGRVSHTFDLRGPSVTVDAAQASSLVAVHLACRSLRAGDAELALAGGVSLLSGRQAGVMLGRGGVLSPDGRCKFGDVSADGFVRAEGAGVVLLKPLARALLDGDRVRAVIAGSAVTNDGRDKETLLHPSEKGQAEAMRRAYLDAGIAPAEVDYVEAHGTGTRIDVAELRALTAVLGQGRPAGRPCLVGSLKSNIGHAEAAGGVAGLIKTVLCLEHGAVPASLHFTTPHPAVDWDRVPLAVPTVLTRLPDRGTPVVAAVNGQGVSSTNVHVVLTTTPEKRAPGGRP
ncbi:Mycocerosate synthase [Parafrankia sp. EAN1pec]|uniref:beta-ketoacyl [acyl carrier protein] synthase domain-containing protein n=1 Tax=Parafrankia sp. (strain EAN1pec) TaxID=298653 RepID=UPI00015DA178|nr:Mycocerosate synthase [Frankia sp. EAN1pec]